MRRISLNIQKRNLLRKNNSQPTLIKYQNKFEYDNSMNIDSFVEGDIKEKLKFQLHQINNQIENIGILCDKRKKSSFEMCKSHFLSERKKLNSFLEESHENLKKEVQNYKNKYNIDYSSHLNEIKKKVKNLDINLTNDKIYLKKIKEKNQILLEEEFFYEREYENMENLNQYLKLTLKNLQNKQIDTIDQQTIRNINRYESLINEPLTDKTKEKKFNLSKSSPNILDKQNKDNNGFYITRTNIPSTTRNVNKRNDIENHLKIKMNFITEKILNNINKENNKKINLQRHFTSLYNKTNNIYMDIFKNSVNELINKDNETLFNENNKYSNPINNSSINSINISKLSTNNDGYMNKLKKKDIIINFLENMEVKKLIFHLLNNKK